MATIYFKIKGKKELEIYKNATPRAVEGEFFYFDNQYEQITRSNMIDVEKIVTDTKPKAVEYAIMFKHSGRYIAVTQQKHEYRIEFAPRKLQNNERLVREWS
jgi:hypothetical protein